MKSSQRFLFQKKYLPYVLLFVLGIFISIHVLFKPLDVLLRWFDVDDGFFYFKVARNFVHGLGFSFDGINRSNGFHPLWMVICVIVYRFFPADLVLPLRVIVLIGGILNGISGIILYRVLSRILNREVSFVLSGLWVTMPAIFKITTTQGMETGLSVMLLLLLIDRAQTWFGPGRLANGKQSLLFGFIALLAILARLDHIFYVGMVCFFSLFGIRFKNRVLLFDVVGISVSVVLSYLLTYNFGEVNYSDHTIFPLLFLSLLLKTGLLGLTGMYAKKRKLPVSGGMKILVLIVIINLGLIPLLYLFNVMELFFRFPKLVIILELIFSTAWISTNHLTHELRSSEEPAVVAGGNWFDKQLLLRTFYITLPIAIGLGTYLSFNQLYFSSALPISGRIKHFWSTLDNPVYGKARNFFDVFGIGERINPWSAEMSWLRYLTDQILKTLGAYTERSSDITFSITLILLILVIIFLLANAKGNIFEKLNGIFLPALFIGSIFRTSFYAMYGYVGIRNWYWVVEGIILLMFVAIIVDLLYTKLRSKQSMRIAGTVILAGMLIFSTTMAVNFGYKNFRINDDGLEMKRVFNGVQTLEQLTPESSLIGMTGGGLEGYFIRNRTIVNLDGLINSAQYYQSLLDGTTALFLDQTGLDYVYGNVYMITISDPYASIFSERLSPIHSTNSKIALFRYLQDKNN